MINYIGLIANIIGGIKGFIFTFSRLGKFIKYLANLEMIANGISTFLNAFVKMWEICVKIKNSKAGKWLLAIATFLISAVGIYAYFF